MIKIYLKNQYLLKVKKQPGSGLFLSVNPNLPEMCLSIYINIFKRMGKPIFWIRMAFSRYKQNANEPNFLKK
jgi:hypothetical protein